MKSQRDTWMAPRPDKPWRHLYNSKAWHRLRTKQLMAEPLCVYCKQQGKVTAARVVDHIKAHRGNESLFYDASNLQSLCAPHHDSSKQKAEKRGVDAIGCGEDGVPISADHHWHKG